ncbi:MAG TPA: helix-turn-helix transcriptional regulator [Stellaceae bacterium]|nr:helix-turn-helix transcriptional regulator [Stellaceae bacterium]
MRSRGRPPTFAGERRYPNPLRELRARLGVPQQAVAAEAGISLAYYGALERGDKRINADTAQRLQRALRCAAGELLSGQAAAATVPLRFVIAAAESEGRPAAFDLSEPWEYLPATRLADAPQCFAAEIADDSADLDFARGTVLFVRALPALAAPLHLGARIVGRFFLAAGDGGVRQTHEILYGILDRNILGDLALITRSRNRLIPRAALIQPAPAVRGGLAEAPLALRRPGSAVEYEPQADDPGEILGLVVYAAGPA